MICTEVKNDTFLLFEHFSPRGEGVTYTGKDWDEEAGLYYFNARWYDPDLGRFTTEDPARDGVNWFVYCGNNPLKFVDPTGLRHVINSDNDEPIVDLSKYNHQKPLRQAGFNRMFGYEEDAGSCMTVALINSYNGIRQDALNATMATAQEKGWLDEDGAPIDIHRFSNELALNSGLKKFISLFYNPQKVKQSYKDFVNSSNYDGIVHLANDNYDHYAYVYKSSERVNSIDSLYPNRKGNDAYNYQTIGVFPYQRLPLLGY